MSRHAGFAIAVSLRQSTTNDALAVQWDNLGPFYFPLPQTIKVGPDTVVFGGLARIAAPIVEFHPNPQDLITAHFAFFSTFNAQISGSSAKRWRVRLDVAVSARLLLGPQNGKITLRLDTSTVTFQPLSVTFLQGPPPPRPLIDAVQSPELAAAATAAVRALPVLTIANLAPSQFEHTQPATFKESGYSVFNWFTIHAAVNRVELRVFEGAVTIAADFAGITNGNRNALVDLTRTHGDGGAYVQNVTQIVDTNAPPFVVQTDYSTPSNTSLSFNLNALSYLIEHQVSPSISGTPVTKDAVVNWISMGYSRFEKPLRGLEDGLVFHIGAEAKGVDADVDVYIQPFLRTFDGPTAYLSGRHDSWLLFVARVDVDLPWWADVAIGIAQLLSVAVGIGIMIPALINVRGFVPLLTGFFDDINHLFATGDTTNIAAATQLAVQGSAYESQLPPARYISIAPDAIDIGNGTGIELPFALAIEPIDGPGVTPNVWSVYDRGAIQTDVQLVGAWQKLIRNNLQVGWEVRRKDNNQVVVTGSKAYNSPGGHGVMIPHHSEQLYYVSEYVVRCSLTMTLGNQVGEVWSGEQVIKIEDDLDRTHSYVEWGPKYVYFANAGTENKTWVRLSRSRIHRTAIAARCKMLRLAVSLRAPGMEREKHGWQYISKYAKFRYKDNLPFAWEELNDHRKELCEYCFFGGPEKLTPYPRYDWFEPKAFKDFEQLHRK